MSNEGGLEYQSAASDFLAFRTTILLTGLSVPRLPVEEALPARSWDLPPGAGLRLEVPPGRLEGAPLLTTALRRGSAPPCSRKVEERASWPLSETRRGRDSSLLRGRSPSSASALL